MKQARVCAAKLAWFVNIQLNTFTSQNKVVHPNHFSEMVSAKSSLLIPKLDLGNIYVVLIHISQTHARDLSDKVTV